MSYVPVLKKIYTEQVVPELVKSRGYKNKHQVPKLVKINLNTGIDADADKNHIADIARDMGAIAGQKPILNRSKKAIANFKLKPNQTTGCSVTLRGPAMWEFLYRLLSVALPSIRDFRGVPSKLASLKSVPIMAKAGCPPMKERDPNGTGTRSSVG